MNAGSQWITLMSELYRAYILSIFMLDITKGDKTQRTIIETQALCVTVCCVTQDLMTLLSITSLLVIASFKQFECRQLKTKGPDCVWSFWGVALRQVSGWSENTSERDTFQLVKTTSAVC